MTEYISKESLLKTIRKMETHTEDGHKVGRWIESGQFIGNVKAVHCSECTTELVADKDGFRVPMLEVFKYCPICGAKMRRGH